MQKERKQAAGQRALLAGTETVADKELNGTIRQREIRRDDMAERAPLKQRFLTGEKEHARLLVALAARAAAETAAVGQKRREIGKAGACRQNGGIQRQPSSPCF